MYKKVISIVKVTLCSMALIGLLTACGSTTNVENVESAVNNKVVESTTVAESGEDIGEDNEGALIKDDSIAVYSYKQGEISGHEVKEEVEDDLADFEVINPNYNGTHAEGELKETVESYITYEDIDPVTMYVISNTTGEQYSIYNDPNVTEGALMMGGLLSANEEVTVDGKATMNGVEYYRLAHQEGSMLNIQLIIPAEYLTAEKMETPVETEKPVEQQTTVDQPTEPLPSEAPAAPEWDPSSGVSQSDWESVFGGGASNGGHTWEPDNGENFNATVNESGGLDITGGDLDPSEVGGLTFH